MKRRAFLQLSVSAAAIAAPASSQAAPDIDCALGTVGNGSNHQDAGISSDVYIPGYWPDSAYFKGKPALDHKKLARAVPKNYRGSIRLLTRLGLNGEIAQALFPVHGHDVQISPDGKIGFYGSLEHQSYVCFDPKTLDLIGLGSPFKKNWIGGGHGIFVEGGSLLAVSERAPRVGYRGKPEHHFGRITLRDPQTLKIIESYSNYGVSPHDIRLLADGKHLAIANYGSTYPRRKNKYGIPRHIVEPSISLIDITDGRLVNKYVSESQDMELRHLCAKDQDTIFAIQTELGLADQDQIYHKADKSAYEAEFTGGKSFSYMAAPTLRANATTAKLDSLGSNEMRSLMRHGLSIRYEPANNEVIATYPATHTIMVFDAGSGDIKHRIDCSKIGLDYPCGLTLLPNSNYYAVAGYWKNLFIFERGSHRLMHELNHFTTFFGHSHITAA